MGRQPRGCVRHRATPCARTATSASQRRGRGRGRTLRHSLLLTADAPLSTARRRAACRLHACRWSAATESGPPARQESRRTMHPVAVRLGGAVIHLVHCRNTSSCASPTCVRAAGAPSAASTSASRSNGRQHTFEARRCRSRSSVMATCTRARARRCADMHPRRAAPSATRRGEEQRLGPGRAVVHLSNATTACAHHSGGYGEHRRREKLQLRCHDARALTSGRAPSVGPRKRWTSEYRVTAPSPTKQARAAAAPCARAATRTRHSDTPMLLLVAGDVPAEHAGRVTATTGTQRHTRTVHRRRCRCTHCGVPASTVALAPTRLPHCDRTHVGAASA